VEKEWFERRVKRIQERLEAEALEGLLLLDTFNVIYASGFFHLRSERPIGLYIPVLEEPKLFVPLLELDHAQEFGLWDVHPYEEFPGREPPVLWMLKQIEESRIGIDTSSAETWSMIKERKPNSRLVKLVSQMRMQKDDYEMKQIRLAASFADLAVHVARTCLESGAELSERELVEEVCYQVVKEMNTRLRCQARLFDCQGTVHSGERAAFPHGLPSDRVIQRGDVVVVGFGAQVNGYHAESGCTFIVGAQDSFTLRMIRAARKARRAVIQGVQPKRTCSEISHLGLSVICEAGLGEYIRHRIGHGVGLQNHEPPWVESNDSTPLSPGMVVSCEPGIYAPGIGGVRCIDTLVITEDGCECLTTYLQKIDDAESHILTI